MGFRLTGTGVVEREGFQSLDNVSGVDVDQDVGTDDELRECRVSQPLGNGSRRVPGKAPVEVLAVIGNHERGAGTKRGDVQHWDRANASPQFPFRQGASPLAHGRHRRVLTSVHAGQDGEPRAIPRAAQLDHGDVVAGQAERAPQHLRWH